LEDKPFLGLIGDDFCLGFVLHENQHDCKEGGCKHELLDPVGEITR